MRFCIVLSGFCAFFYAFFVRKFLFVMMLHCILVDRTFGFVRKERIRIVCYFFIRESVYAFGTLLTNQIFGK